MVDESFVECTFLIPIHGDAALSAGRLHTQKQWDWLTDQLFDSFGGGTQHPGLYEGFYTDPDTGQRVADVSQKFTVAVARAQIQDLRELLQNAAVVFRQKCLYLSVAAEVEYVAHPDL